MNAVAVRNLRHGDVLATTGETVITVQPMPAYYGRSSNRNFGRNKRMVCLSKQDGSQRWAEWNAGTNISVVAAD